MNVKVTADGVYQRQKRYFAGLKMIKLQISSLSLHRGKEKKGCSKQGHKGLRLLETSRYKFETAGNKYMYMLLN